MSEDNFLENSDEVDKNFPNDSDDILKTVKKIIQMMYLKLHRVMLGKPKTAQSNVGQIQNDQGNSDEVGKSSSEDSDNVTENAQSDVEQHQSNQDNSSEVEKSSSEDSDDVPKTAQSDVGQHQSNQDNSGKVEKSYSEDSDNVTENAQSDVEQHQSNQDNSGEVEKNSSEDSDDVPKTAQSDVGQHQSNQDNSGEVEKSSSEDSDNVTENAQSDVEQHQSNQDNSGEVETSPSKDSDDAIENAPTIVEKTKIDQDHLDEVEKNYSKYSDDLHDEYFNIIINEPWCIAGASVIGRGHKIEGTYREDAFKIAKLNGWYIMAVADGAGSRTLAHVGSNLIVNSAIAAMKNRVESIDLASYDEEFAKNSREIIFDGINDAHKRILNESKSKDVDICNFGSTLLLVAYLPFENSSEGGGIIHVAQVGDGIIAAVLDEDFKMLSDPDVGEDGGTFFLTSVPYIEDQQRSPWINRVKTYYVKKKVDQIIALTDGLSEDFYPYEKCLPDFLKNVRGILIEMDEMDVEEHLINLLNQEKRANFDDKTLAIIYNQNWHAKGN